MKKITVYIPDETYNLLFDYCNPFPGFRYYFKNVINLAIINYCSKNTANFSSNDKNKDVTYKYLNMLDSFSCDFSLAADKNYYFDLNELQEQINNNSNLAFIQDIKLLEELSFKLRHNKLKIFEV